MIRASAFISTIDAACSTMSCAANNGVVILSFLRAGTSTTLFPTGTVIFVCCVGRNCPLVDVTRTSCVNGLSCLLSLLVNDGYAALSRINLPSLSFFFLPLILRLGLVRHKFSNAAQELYCSSVAFFFRSVNVRRLSKKLYSFVVSLLQRPRPAELLPLCV